MNGNEGKELDDDNDDIDNNNKNRELIKFQNNVHGLAH